ncbi:MAG TPA: phage virion morphogenesis protein [Stellaceae bacterium]|nr:phage virion morphogenesis protein [Stellaceae bacterium]
MIDVQVNGLDTLAARFAALPQTLGARLAEEVERLGGVLRDRVERNLSGQVLQQRSGRLAGSIAISVERSGSGASATVSSDSPYAAIHEYGGMMPARTILPQNARALAFPWRGQQRFFKRVTLPAVAMPERSFMRSALAASEGEIRAAIEAAAAQAVQG